MAVSLNPSPLQSRVNAYLPSSIKASSGLRFQSPNSFGIGNKSIHVARTKNIKPRRGCIVNIAFPPPQIYIKNPGDQRGQFMSVKSFLFRERLIMIGGEITDQLSNYLLCTLLYLDSQEDTRKPYFMINSPGGDVTACLTVYDTMQCTKTPVGTHCIGQAENMAAFLLIGGAKGFRTSYQTPLIVLSEPAGPAYGRADAVKIESDELLRTRAYIYREIAKQTGQPEEKIYKDLAENGRKRFSAEEAVEYGLIDRLVLPKVKTKAEKESTTKK